MTFHRECTLLVCFCFVLNKFERENKILELTFNIKVHALLVPTNSTCSFTVISPWIWQLHIFNMQWRFSMLPFDFYTAIWALFTLIQEKERFYIYVYIYVCFIYSTSLISTPESISSTRMMLLLTGKQLIKKALLLCLVIKGISTCLKDHCQGKPQDVLTHDWNN